jgi:hypothetical protein
MYRQIVASSLGNSKPIIDVKGIVPHGSGLRISNGGTASLLAGPAA